MTGTPDLPELAARTALASLADEAQDELLVARAIEARDLAPGADVRALEVAEFGYYEAELGSLRDAAIILGEGRNVGE